MCIDDYYTQTYYWVILLFYTVNGDKEINKKAEGELDHLQTPDLYDQGAYLQYTV